MTRPRRASGTSDGDGSSGTAGNQELGSMYDYLVKIILLGPSGTGKSCLLHRFVKSEWRVLSSQTIGVEFANKIIKVGTGARRKRIKLQLWDTAGTERFRSVSRSFYRGAAGAILVYDVTSQTSFAGLQPFLNDARALASPNLTVLLVGNKLDLANGSDHLVDTSLPLATPSSASSILNIPYGPLSSALSPTPSSQQQPQQLSAALSPASPPASPATIGLGAQLRATVAPDGREVSALEAGRWASAVHIPVTMEVSALSGEGVDEVFGRLARMILTKIELGEIDPDDPMSGIQYGDAGFGVWNNSAGSDGGSNRSHATAAGDDVTGTRRRRGRLGGRRILGFGGGGGGGSGSGGVPGGTPLRDWEDVFTLTGRRRRRGCDGC